MLIRHFLVLKATDIVSFDKNEIKLGDSTAIILPLEIYQLELTRAVDLRLPVIQDFFTFIFARLETVYGLGGYNKMGGEAMNVMQKKELPDFKSLLPTLVTPQPGGTSFLDFIGAICRNCEVDGLIFPSARRDVFVEHLKDHGIQSFSGWNFVDYRAAGAVDATTVLELLGLQVQWLTANHVGVQIEWDDTKLHRRWRVHGAENGERNRYRIEWEIMMGQKVPNPSWTPWFAGRERNLRQ